MPHKKLLAGMMSIYTFGGVKHEEFLGTAIVLAWPDTTARGDELWMAMLKKVGLVKNLNFKVGHAAVVLVNHSTSELSYFDFGRYITARGMGRTRSSLSDPRLKIDFRANIDERGQISNLHQIAQELDRMSAYTHGKGRMFFSVSDTLSFSRAYQYAHQMVLKGSMPYGALAYRNSSCSRFVAQTVVAGLKGTHPAVRKLLLPESIMPSPISNVVNAGHAGKVYCYHQGVMDELDMSRLQSLKFLISQLTENFSHHAAQHFPNDIIIGSMQEPNRPASLPPDVQWLGGIGEGAWYRLIHTGGSNFTATRYDEQGEVDFSISCHATEGFDFTQPFSFTYDSHHIFATIQQHGRTFKMNNMAL